MFVAYKVSHKDTVDGYDKDEVERGILDTPGLTVEFTDLYEADVAIETFTTREQAQQWLDER